MYKFKVKANSNLLEKYGYKDGAIVRVYEKEYFYNCYNKRCKAFKIYDIINKKMVWVDAYTTTDF